ncbi:hypothetical protein VTL71DRAFT_8732 [Oculimacula yallundae]|uniref:Uncharacterized protein n=1 Tax=Oculimacula yallundae TaxID=86028 RepID=A0ABR4CYJ2_9HELO
MLWWRGWPGGWKAQSLCISSTLHSFRRVGREWESKIEDLQEQTESNRRRSPAARKEADFGTELARVPEHHFYRELCLIERAGLASANLTGLLYVERIAVVVVEARVVRCGMGMRRGIREWMDTGYGGW